MLKSMLTILLLLLIGGHLLGQNKFERETRIPAVEAPEKAQHFINELHFTKKVKWYREQSLTGLSFEAKTKHLGNKYSIEFSPDGIVEDIEQDLAWPLLPSAVRDNINAYLSRAHEMARPQRVQVQYTGTPKALLQHMQSLQANLPITNKYEIIVKAKTNGKRELIEYLFSATGVMERKSTIIFNNTDNLEY